MLYLVSKYIPGPTLAKAVRTHNPLDENSAWGLTTGAVTALHAATSTEPFRGANLAEVGHLTATVDPDLSTIAPT
ncbi:hypothetical protein O1L60_39505 [Streptomyces diastatochromogenes]|nr:hypothetical protein [Streptomyces diastatochromogenes]